MAASEEETTEGRTPTGEELIEIHGVWGEHPTWSVADWKYEVDNDDTRAGYWDWVSSNIDANS